ncbi:unnamed protein product [Cochlearia groenlandica]
MDMATCVARRTRSRTESYLNSILNKTKSISSEDLSSERKNKRDSMHDCSSSSSSSQPSVKSKRRRRKAAKDDEVDVELIGTNDSKGKQQDNDEHVELGSESPDFDFDSNLCDEKKDDLDVKIPELDEVVVNLCSDGECSVEDEEDSDEDDDDEDDDSASSDYMEESSDSSYSDSSESGFDCSEDDDEVGKRYTASKANKSSSGKSYTLEERKKSLNRKVDFDVCKLLAKSIWERTKIFDEDNDSEDDRTAEVDAREAPVVRERSSRKVNEQRKPRSVQRVKEIDHSDLVYGGDEKQWESPPLILSFPWDEPETIEKTEEEEEIDSLWEDMAFALISEGVHSSTPAAKNGVVPCSNGTHDFVLDEEIGLKCCHCSYVSVEVKDISPAMDTFRANVNDKKTCSERKGVSLLNRLDFEASDHSNHAASLSNTQGTVWEYIPGVKDTLYPHQQEGFEFLWNNLAGATQLDELTSSGASKGGGCIISHSPGTGKTRLTVVFLLSYLERFPDSRPMVIAPSTVLFTWQQEFRKWNTNVPFYDINSLELSGQENQSAVSLLKGNTKHKHSVRMVKLYSWRNKKSVLGVSYSLYEKLVGKKFNREIQEFRKMLLELPGVLVLDEGHTPRNQNSCIWKVLSEVKTHKRIILSGTPFQNNFKELSNVLCLARPAYTSTISSRLQDLSKWNQEGKTGRCYEEIGIVELKDLIAPFVHVHLIAPESLPGLRDCVVVLNPPYQQKKILDRIDPCQNTFELEHKLSATSVHPSLYLCCNPTKKERFVIGPSALKSLEKVRLNSNEGAKTRFLVDFIRFSETVKEKVLVFSQYIDTLKLIMDQLCAVLGWTEGQEILFMHGQIEQRERQLTMNNFNNPDSESKVLLASTRACSEGINLTGGSRVLFLDVVWNPSVERQAIGRCYRTGQKKVVYSYHLMIKDTAEWVKYCKQSKKHRISEMVFSSSREKDMVINKDVVSEDKILDEMVKSEKLKDMFEKILYHPKESSMFTNIL